jgi:LacI family transcriptional regulator
VAVSLSPYPDYQLGILQGVRSFLTTHPGAFDIVTHSGNPYVRPDQLATMRPDGIIANIQQNTLAAFQALQVPVVKIGSRGPGQAFPTVEMDNDQAGRVAASHLVGLGLPALGCVVVKDAAWAQARAGGFYAAASGFRLPVETLELTNSEEIEIADRDALVAWLRRLPRPGGIFAVTDLLARRVVEAARAAGVAVPREQAVLGFNNGLYECLFSEPHLSSVPQDRARLGYEAARLLHEQMAGRPTPTGVQVRAGPAVRRRSTAILSWTDPVLRECMEFLHRQQSDVVGLGDMLEAYPEQALRLARRLNPADGEATDQAEAARLRLMLAEQLARESELSWARVAECSGFWEEPRLRLAFHDAFGLDPADYRARFGRIG